MFRAKSRRQAPTWSSTYERRSCPMRNGRSGPARTCRVQCSEGFSKHGRQIYRIDSLYPLCGQLTPMASSNRDATPNKPPNWDQTYSGRCSLRPTRLQEPGAESAARPGRRVTKTAWSSWLTNSFLSPSLLRFRQNA